MSDPSFSRASGIAWENYYRAVEGRAPRPLFVAALELTQRAGVAVDLGCGDGTEMLVLLAAGWRVVAVDAAPEGIERLRAAVPAPDTERLTTVVSPFHELELPEADFVYAGLSLPFCDPDDFGEAWSRTTAAVRPGGVLAVHLFGLHDTWADKPEMTFHSREDVEALLRGFEVQRLHEQDEEGQAVSGPKHWHVFHVIATRRTEESS